MIEDRKTKGAVAIAFGLVLLAWATAPKPTIPDRLQYRGSGFFPGFSDPAMIQSLEVVEFDEETATARPFRVAVEKRRWVAPSYYGYLIDGRERLSSVAAGLIALKKDNVATENVSEQERTGTVDPLDETSPTLHGRGTRVTVKGENDRILADIIIGTALGQHPEFRYVRLATQSRIYVARAGDLELSTRFVDWIDRDLLHIEWDDIDQLIVRDYVLDKATRGVNLRDNLFVQKLGEDDEGRVRWTMRGLTSSEHVDVFRANLLNTALDQLAILDVRPKPSGVAAALAENESRLRLSQADLSDLAEKGFHFTPKGELVSDYGELLVHTRTGVFFRLWFGNVAEPAVDTPVGMLNAHILNRSSKTTPGSDGPGVLSTRASETVRSDGKVTRGAADRYLIVTASFDPTVGDGDPQTQNAARMRATGLRTRFAPWYYVISGQSFEQMRLSRRILVKASAVKN